jgi:ketosteroid isomerase-like protein
VSRGNVEVVCRVVEAWNRRDLDAALRHLAPDVEWAPAGPAAVERVVYCGPEECARGFAAVWETWDVFRFKETEVRDHGDSALWLGHVHMRGRTSHVELDQEFGIHFVVRDDKVVQAHAFPSWSNALEAAGLSE